MRLIRDRLRAFYGRPRNEPHHAPLDELVLTVLSQNTNDRNRDIAYARLRARFPDWAGGARGAARGGRGGDPAGRHLEGEVEADPGDARHDRGGDRRRSTWSSLATAPRERAIEFLERLPGVGRKTAACVLLFSFDRPEMPVDTHVYRVASRLGLIRPKASFEEAHDTLLALDRPRRTSTSYTST